LPTGLVLPWVTALLLVFWPRSHDRLSPFIATLGALLTALSISLGLLSRQATGPMTLLDFPFGSWVLDGLTGMFLLLTAWIHLLVTIFSWRYLPQAQVEEGSRRRDASFYALLHVFSGSMLAQVTSGSLIQLYVFWELTGIASFLLIGYWHQDPKAREGALRSLVMTTAGGVAMLLGFLGLAAIAGTSGLPELLAGRLEWQSSPMLAGITALILLGALAKSAQVPFSGWLPGAMAAPTPVSAFLHSATLIAAGVYLLARFFPMLHAAPTWSGLLVPSGLIGGVLAGIMALRQAEIKALLAYSTISQYAFIFMAFGLGTVVGAQAGLYAFFVHAFIKAGLFLVAGAVTALSGSKRFDALGGLARSHRVLAILATILAFSLGGVPIFGGFYYKEELLHAAYEQQAWLLLVSLLGGGMLTFLYMLRFVTEIFWGEEPKESPAAGPGALPLSMLTPVAILAAVAMVTGIFPNWMNLWVLNPAIASVIQAPADFSVVLEPGGVFLLSLGVLALGGGIWALGSRGWIPERWIARMPRRFNFGGAAGLRLYTTLSERLLGLQTGNLRQYLRWELLACLGLVLVCWWGVDWGPGKSEVFDPALALMLGLCLLAALATIWLTHHVLAVIALTISGYALAVVFALLEAPDVALAQVLVETLATFSIVMALRQSQQVHPERTKILTAGRNDWGRWAISLGIGGTVAALTYQIGRSHPPNSAGAHYAAEGFSLNGMSDLVTAILADFRALDTAVEILVFACAAFAVMGLFPRRRDE
jgi:NADH:ubiquinone oxidoreductase subunit 5 (subunit L)/multisubunit Na+/H+ antiporter MnhA subunit